MTTTDPTLADIKALVAECLEILQTWHEEATTKEARR